MRKPQEPKDNAFGERLTKLRKAQRLSQKELAGRLGCDPSMISKLECGNKVPQWIEIYVNLSVALGVPVAEILGASESPGASADPGLVVRVRTLAERLSPAQVPAFLALLDAALDLATGHTAETP